MPTGCLPFQERRKKQMLRPIASMHWLSDRFAPDWVTNLSVTVVVGFFKLIFSRVHWHGIGSGDQEG